MKSNPFYKQWSDRGRPHGRPWGETNVGLTPAALLCLPLLVFLLAAGIAAGLRLAPRGAASLPEAGPVQARHEGALRERLRVNPQDNDARLRLSWALLITALAAAQASCPGGEGWEPAGPEYHGHLARTLPASPGFQEAGQLAEAVAKRGQDRRQRARGWIRLGELRYFLDDRPGRIACLEQAVREDPSWRKALADLVR